MGRPSKLSPQIQEAICKSLKAGATREAAALSAGISKSTFYSWIEKGEQAKNGEFPDFLDALTRAEAECELRMTAVLSKAAGGWDTRQKRTKTRSVIKMKRTREPDGTIIEEPVVLTLTETEEIEGREFDWKAALEWLKRRRRPDWGDHADPAIDEKIQQLMAFLASGGQA